jgi:hypothetical protein
MTVAPELTKYDGLIQELFDTRAIYWIHLLSKDCKILPATSSTKNGALFFSSKLHKHDELLIPTFRCLKPKFPAEYTKPNQPTIPKHPSISYELSNTSI